MRCVRRPDCILQKGSNACIDRPAGLVRRKRAKPCDQIKAWKPCVAFGSCRWNVKAQTCSLLDCSEAKAKYRCSDAPHCEWTADDKCVAKPATVAASSPALLQQQTTVSDVPSHCWGMTSDDDCKYHWHPFHHGTCTGEHGFANNCCKLASGLSSECHPKYGLTNRDGSPHFSPRSKIECDLVADVCKIMGQGSSKMVTSLGWCALEDAEIIGTCALIGAPDGENLNPAIDFCETVLPAAYTYACKKSVSSGTAFVCKDIAGCGK